MNSYDEYWIDLESPERYAEIYGPNWRSLPIVYGSLGMNGDDRRERMEEQETIGRLLHPHFLYLSPYRGCGKADIFRQGNHFERLGVLNPRHCTTRDYNDVRRARVVLVNMAAPKRKMFAICLSSSTGPNANLALVTPQDYESIKDRVVKVGETEINVPLTGTIAEIIEAHSHGIPVVGYNESKASDQMNSPFVRDRLAICCRTYQDAIEYIVAKWFV